MATLEQFEARIAHNPLGFGWGQRGDLRVPSRVGRECRWCTAALTGRRTSWCGPVCIEAYFMRSNWSAMRRYVVKRDRRCRICAYECGGAGEVDHVIAVIEGGTDDPANLRLLCVPCHQDVTAAMTRRRASESRRIGLQLESR